MLSSIRFMSSAAESRSRRENITCCPGWIRSSIDALRAVFEVEIEHALERARALPARRARACKHSAVHRARSRGAPPGVGCQHPVEADQMHAVCSRSLLLQRRLRSVTLVSLANRLML